MSKVNKPPSLLLHQITLPSKDIVECVAYSECSIVIILLHMNEETKKLKKLKFKEVK